MGNFIDKTFTVIADILLKVLPASKQEKEAFSYYRAGMSAQSRGRYAEALRNYYEALQVEEDPYDRSYTLYNIGLIYGNTGKYTQALEFYHQALSLNANLPQALNNIAVIYHSQALRAQSLEEGTLSQALPATLDIVARIGSSSSISIQKSHADSFMATRAFQIP